MPRSKKTAVGPKPALPLPAEYIPDRKRRTPLTANGRIHHHIVERLCALTRAAGLYDASEVPLIAVRVKDWLEATADAAQVELVLTTIVEDKCNHLDFVPLRDFTPGAWEHYKRLLDIPTGGWAYALWRESVTSDRTRWAIDYWLGVWKDQLGELAPEAIAEDPIIERAKKALEALKTTAHLETVTWL